MQLVGASSVRPKPGFGIANPNQGPDLVWVSFLSETETFFSNLRTNQIRTRREPPVVHKDFNIISTSVQNLFVVVFT